MLIATKGGHAATGVALETTIVLAMVSKIPDELVYVGSTSCAQQHATPRSYNTAAFWQLLDCNHVLAELATDNQGMS